MLGTGAVEPGTGKKKMIVKKGSPLEAGRMPAVRKETDTTIEFEVDAVSFSALMRTAGQPDVTVEVAEAYLNAEKDDVQ